MADSAQAIWTCSIRGPPDSGTAPTIAGLPEAVQATDRTGKTPFRKSSTNAAIPQRRPAVRAKLVAPMLRLPAARMSTPRQNPRSKANGTDPRR